MSRTTTALIVALLGVIGIQGWLLHQANKPAGRTNNVPASTNAVDGPDPAVARHVDANRIDASQIDANQLARIDARLSALETASATTPSPPQREIVLGSPEALAADRKIAALLPDGPMTPQELFLLQLQIARSPSRDQAQLSAALARTINNGQVQIGLKP
ncbi:MAG: hypothetical protein ABL934_09045 [Lysobacteraceae bacterium]